ncbi:triadin-like, partial [Thalassophryne amazonica]|uniref:triadin-like n=1 Tax=Thalassophryne amazonica TaxID=390379 RepID=UPI00147254D6
MTETAEARLSTTTTMVIDKNVDAGSTPVRTPKRTFTDDLYSTFSSPLAWILVLALIITWSCVFVIIFDLTAYKSISGRPLPAIRKVLKESGQRGSLSKISSDPMKAVNDVVDESTSVLGAMFRFAVNIIAPDEDEGNLYAVRKKGEFLPSRSKVIGMQAEKQAVVPTKEHEEEGDEVEAAEEEEEEY